MLHVLGLNRVTTIQACSAQLVVRTVTPLPFVLKSHEGLHNQDMEEVGILTFDKGGIKEVIKVVEVGEDLGRYTMSFVEGGMSQVNVGMKANHGPVGIVGVIIPPKIADNLIR